MLPDPPALIGTMHQYKVGHRAVSPVFPTQLCILKALGGESMLILPDVRSAPAQLVPPNIQAWKPALSSQQNETASTTFTGVTRHAE